MQRPEGFPALLLEPEPALRWLSSPVEALPSEASSGSEEVGIDGADLRFWRMAARFALGLLRRERWLPSMERDGEGRFVARWSPALNQPEDAARFRALCEAMPTVGRAVP